MRKFLIYITSVLFATILFLGVGEYMAMQVPNPYKYKEEWMQEHHSEVTTLVFGGSQCFYGIKPELLDGKAFNLANVSQGFEYDLYLLKRYDCPKLKTVIIPISYPSLFAEELEESSEWYRAIFYKIYMDYPKHTVFSKYNFEVSNYRTYTGKIKKFIFKSSDKGFDEWGWGNTYQLSKKNLSRWNNGDEARNAIRRHSYSNLSRVSENYKIIVSIINECRRRNVYLFFITTPCWHLYNDLQDKRQYDKMMETIHTLEREYGIVYLDYSRDPRFIEEDFYDSNHLSDIGASKFSCILNEEIRTLLK